LDKVKKQGAVVDQINAFIKNMMWFLPLLLIIIPPAIYLFGKTMTQAQFYAYILLATSFRTYTAEHLTLWIYLKDAQGATLRLATILSSPNEKKTGAVCPVPEAGDIVFRKGLPLLMTKSRCYRTFPSRSIKEKRPPWLA
jgi:ABC-type bacteriocin/lantibiotic exporter with double-glycine peptidase domain